MDNQQGRSFDLGWFIGVLESEGSLSYVKGRRNKRGQISYAPNIGIVNSNRDCINKCIKFLNDNFIPHYVYKRKEVRSKLKTNFGIIHIQISGYKRAKKLLTLITPFMQFKKKQAEKLLEIIEYRLSLPYNYKYGEREENTYLEMRRLNGTLRDYTPNTLIM